MCTERDIFNAHGTFYELPAENAGGVEKIRPIATHNCRIKDSASYRGLMVISGISKDAVAGEHIMKSVDGKCALWIGAVDDLWKLGKPRGTGGPWKDSDVKAGAASDPYLMAGYDGKTVELTAGKDVKITLEVNVAGQSGWFGYKTFELKAGETITHRFDKAFSAHWIRAVADKDCKSTVWLTYE